MATYPLPKFHFQVEWGGAKIGFTEVTGLNVETDVIEYRDGASPEYHKIKIILYIIDLSNEIFLLLLALFLFSHTYFARFFFFFIHFISFTRS